MNYLSEDQFKTALRLGKAIEQWLGVIHHDDYDMLKWIRIEKEKNSEYSVVYFETFDEGNEDFFDIYEFSPVDPDNPYGIITSFDELEEALIFAYVEYGCKKDRFVNSGMIQNEYKKYVESK